MKPENKNKVYALSIAMRNACRADNLIFSTVGEREYEDKWSSAWKLVCKLRNELFKLITDERLRFEDFYDSFAGPGHPDGKPVAWENGFIPDNITEVLQDTKMPTQMKIEKVTELYKRCVKIREVHQVRSFENYGSKSCISKTKTTLTKVDLEDALNGPKR